VYKRGLQQLTKVDYFLLYAILLVVIVSGLFLSGKLIGGVARLTAYSVPAISILIIAFLEDVRTKFNKARFANITAITLFLGLIGNIISTCINTFTYPEYSNRIKTYRQTAKALKEARPNNIPILYTDGVRGDQLAADALVPGMINDNMITPEQIEGEEVLAAEVILKVNPEYKVWDPVPTYFIRDTKWISEYMKQLPEEYDEAIVGDGMYFRRLNR
jgi:hypothetical protein